MSIFCHIYDPVVMLDADLSENILTADQLLGTHFVVRNNQFDPYNAIVDGYTTISLTEPDLVPEHKYRFTITNYSNRRVFLTDFWFFWHANIEGGTYPVLEPGQAVELFNLHDAVYQTAYWKVRGTHLTDSIPF
jgi:hypothetical protein